MKESGPDESRTDVAPMLNAQLGGYNAMLGLRFVSASDRRVEAELTVEPKHCQPYGIVHGGVYCSVIETVCSTGAALNALFKGKGAVGLENQTSFIRATRSGILRVVALPITNGRSTAVWEATVYDAEQRVVATGRVRLLCIEPDRAIDGKTVAASGM